MVQIRKAMPEDASFLAEGMARAFAPQPFTRWMCGDDLALGRRTLDVELKHALQFGMTYTTEPLMGAALWHSPQVNFWNNIGYFVDQFRVIGIGRKTPRQIYELLQLEKKHPKQFHYYLAVLAVFPEFQGQGVGAALLKPMLDRCDVEQMPAYLLTDTEANVQFYQKYGFHVLWESGVDGNAFTAWGMWRKPQV